MSSARRRVKVTISASEASSYVGGGGAAGQHCVRLSVGHLGQLFLIFLLDGRRWRPEGAVGVDEAKRNCQITIQKDLKYRNMKTSRLNYSLRQDTINSTLLKRLRRNSGYRATNVVVVGDYLSGDLLTLPFCKPPSLKCSGEPSCRLSLPRPPEKLMSS